MELPVLQSRLRRQSSSETKTASRGIVAVIVLAALLLVVGTIAAGVWIVRLLGRLIG